MVWLRPLFSVVCFPLYLYAGVDEHCSQMKNERHYPCPEIKKKETNSKERKSIGVLIKCFLCNEPFVRWLYNGNSACFTLAAYLSNLQCSVVLRTFMWFELIEAINKRTDWSCARCSITSNLFIGKKYIDENCFRPCYFTWKFRERVKSISWWIWIIIDIKHLGLNSK